MEISNFTGEEYHLKDYVCIRDPKQQRLYIKHEVYPIEMYVTEDIKTKKDILVMLFSKEKTRHLYLLYKNRELE